MLDPRHFKSMDFNQIRGHCIKRVDKIIDLHRRVFQLPRWLDPPYSQFKKELEDMIWEEYKDLAKGE